MTVMARDESYIGWVLRGLNQPSIEGGWAFAAAIMEDDEADDVITDLTVGGRRYGVMFTHHGIDYGYRIDERRWVEV